MKADSKIKVCHLASTHKMNDMRIFEKECKSLVQTGMEVTLIGFGPQAKTEIIDGVTCISLYCPIKNNLEILTKRNKITLKAALAVEADIYHIHEPLLLPLASKLKRKGKVVIFDSHEFYGWQLRDNIHKIKVIRVPDSFMKVIGNLYMHYEKRICRRIDGVVQVCTMNGVDYFSHRCKRSVFVRNLPNSSDYTRRTPINADEASIAMIGGISKERGITQLVEAAYLTHTKLYLAGPFLPKSYEQELSQLEAYQNVVYKGFLDKEGMISLLDQSSIGAATLLNLGQYDKIDTFPTKVYDYMAMELPVILSDTRYARLMNEKYHFAICVDPGDITSIREAIEWLITHPNEALEMGRNGRKAIEQELNWEKESQKLVDFYHELLSLLTQPRNS